MKSFWRKGKLFCCLQKEIRNSLIEHTFPGYVHKMKTVLVFVICCDFVEISWILIVSTGIIPGWDCTDYRGQLANCSHFKRPGRETRTRGTGNQIHFWTLKLSHLTSYWRAHSRQSAKSKKMSWKINRLLWSWMVSCGFISLLPAPEGRGMGLGWYSSIYKLYSYVHLILSWHVRRQRPGFGIK